MFCLLWARLSECVGMCLDYTVLVGQFCSCFVCAQASKSFAINANVQSEWYCILSRPLSSAVRKKWLIKVWFKWAQDGWPWVCPLSSVVVVMSQSINNSLGKVWQLLERDEDDWLQASLRQCTQLKDVPISVWETHSREVLLFLLTGASESRPKQTKLFAQFGMSRSGTEYTHTHTHTIYLYFGQRCTRDTGTATE